MSEVWSFLLQNPPLLYLPLNSHNLTPIIPHVTLNNSILIPLERTPCMLEVTFDPHFKINDHVKSFVTRAASRINTLGLTGTNCGQQNETVLITYKPLFTYAAPIQFPNSSPSIIRKLLSIQNSAVRIATGCVTMTSIYHLHEEIRMFPVQNHLSLISSQYLVRALQPNNPSHSVVTFPPGYQKHEANPSNPVSTLACSVSIERYSTSPLIMGPPSSSFILTH